MLGLNIKYSFLVFSDVYLELIAANLYGTLTCFSVVNHRLAAVEKLKFEDANALGGTERRCAAALGLSVGEFAALVYADALSFDDAISLVGTRAKAMSEAAHQLQVRCPPNAIIGCHECSEDAHPPVVFYE